MTTSAAQAGRPRSPDAHRAILAAAYELLLEKGYRALSIEGVAIGAGVGKMTIYRWWPSKGVLAVEAFLSETAKSLAFAETGSARGDITRQMMALAALYRGATGKLVRELIGASQSDAEMRTAFQNGFLEPRREAGRQAFSRGVATGEFGHVDPDIAIDALYGPLYYRILASDGSIDDASVSAIADAVFDGLRA